MTTAVNGSDEQISEAYRSFKKKDLINYKNFIEKIVSDTTVFYNSLLSLRKPKIKVVNNEKKIRFMKPLQSNEELKIVSKNPSLIIGAAEVWLVNVKSKTLTVLRARDSDGLDVHRTAIINYDEKNSCTKRIGRNAENAIYAVMSGKSGRQKIMKEIKTSPSVLKYMVNPDTIILNVIRNK